MSLEGFLWPDGPTYMAQVGIKMINNTCANGMFPPQPSTPFVLPFIEKCPTYLVKNPHKSDTGTF